MGKKGGKRVALYYYIGVAVYLLGILLFARIEMDVPWIPGIWRIGARTVMGLLWPVFLIGWALYMVFFVGLNPWKEW